MHTTLSPVGNMNLLSQIEVDQLQESAASNLYKLYRNCSLAVLNSGSHTDDAEEIYQQYQDFQIKVLSRERGVKLDLNNPPLHAFVDGKIIKGIQEHLSAVLRDILFINTRYISISEQLVPPSEHITHVVFDILRNASVILPKTEANLITCWGGHSINDTEYKYTKKVGYQLGLRGFNICTGCVNEIVIMPDIEKRLEAFVRMSHGIIIFPGGAGTAEELLYILGIMLNTKNREQKLPIILTGPAQSADYFNGIDTFIGETLGEKAQQLYQIIIDDAQGVSQAMKAGLTEVISHRKQTGDAYHFNWSLFIDSEFQQPFEPTHQKMAELPLESNLETANLAANLRKIFSGIVAGNVKSSGIKSIREHGPFIISGEPKIMNVIDDLLASFVSQQRMKLPGSRYVPCYKVSEGRG